MRNLRTATAEDHVGLYGPTWRRGVLAEHLSCFLAAGGTTRKAASGSGLRWAVLPDGTTAPFVCGAIVLVQTEDGPIDGRCGADATHEGLCESHDAEADAWLAASEADRLAWERSNEVSV